MPDREPEPFIQEWPEPGWEGHRKQQLQDVVRFTTPAQRLEWLEEMLMLLDLPLKEDYWRGP